MIRSRPTSRCLTVAAALALWLAPESVTGTANMVSADRVAVHSLAVSDTAWQEVARVGGVIRAVAAEGDRAYVALGPRVLVLAAASPGVLTLVGTSPALADAPRVLAPDGARLHVAIDGVGLVTLDVRDPGAITIASIVPMAGRWTALVRSGTRLAAIVDRSLIVFDCGASPPIELGRAEQSTLFDYIPQDIAWAGAFLALSTSEGLGKGGGFGVVDVSVPSKPELRGWVEDEHPVVIGARAGRLAVTLIVDATTPGGEASTEWVLAAYGISANGDLSPLGRTVLDEFGGPVDVVFEGDVAFVGNALANTVIAVGAPGDGPPIVLSRWSSDTIGIPSGDVGIVSGLAVAAGRIFVPQVASLGREGICRGPGVLALAVGPSTALAIETKWATADTGAATAVAIDGTTAFVANPGCGLRAYDVSNPEVPQIRDAWWAGRGLGIGDQSGFSPNSLVLEGGRLYASDAESISGAVSVRIFDARRLPLVQLGAIDLPGVTALSVRGRTMVVVGTAPDPSGGPSKAWLRVFDVGDPKAPVQTGLIDDELDSVRDVAAIADGLFVAATGANHYVMDTRPSGEPKTTAVLPTNGAPRRVAAVSNVGFVSALLTPRGASPLPLGLLDVLGATDRTLLAKSRVVEPVPGRAFAPCHRWGLAVDRGRAYVAPMNGLVYAVDIDDPNAARLVVALRTGGSACDVAVAGDVMAVADGEAGLALFRRGEAREGMRGERVFLPFAGRRRTSRP